MISFSPGRPRTPYGDSSKACRPDESAGPAHANRPPATVADSAVSRRSRQVYPCIPNKPIRRSAPCQEGTPVDDSDEGRNLPLLRRGSIELRALPGAQGAGAEQAVCAFRVGTGGREGGIVNSSRAILYPECESWETGFEAALGEAIDQLGEAVR